MSAKIEINKYYLIDHRTRGMLKVKVLEYEGTEWVKVRILKSNREYDNIYHNGRSAVKDEIIIQKSLAIWRKWEKESTQYLEADIEKNGEMQKCA